MTQLGTVAVGDLYLLVSIGGLSRTFYAHPDEQTELYHFSQYLFVTGSTSAHFAYWFVKDASSTTFYWLDDAASPYHHVAKYTTSGLDPDEFASYPPTQSGNWRDNESDWDTNGLPDIEASWVANAGDHLDWTRSGKPCLSAVFGWVGLPASTPATLVSPTMASPWTFRVSGALNGTLTPSTSGYNLYYYGDQIIPANDTTWLNNNICMVNLNRTQGSGGSLGTMPTTSYMARITFRTMDLRP